MKEKKIGIGIPCVLVFEDGSEMKFSTIRKAMQYMEIDISSSGYYVDKYRLLGGCAYLFKASTMIDRSRLCFGKCRKEKIRVYYLKPDMTGKIFETIAEAAKFAKANYTTIYKWVQFDRKHFKKGGWWFTQQQLKKGKKDKSIEQMISIWKRKEGYCNDG